MPSITAFCCMKNCEEYVDAWLKNVKDADEIIVQDGGSTDKIGRAHV